MGANYGGVLINENKGGKDLKFGYIFSALMLDDRQYFELFSVFCIVHFVTVYSVVY